MKSAFKDNVFIGKKLDIQAQDRMCRRTWKELNLTYIPAGKKKMALSSWMTIWTI